jgi:hypothetical protein
LVPFPVAFARLNALQAAVRHPHSQRPPSPAVVVAATATDGGGRARQIVADRRRPHRPAAALTVPSTSVLRPWRSDIPSPFPVGAGETLAEESLQTKEKAEKVYF